MTKHVQHVQHDQHDKHVERVQHVPLQLLSLCAARPVSCPTPAPLLPPEFPAVPRSPRVVPALAGLLLLGAVMVRIVPSNAAEPATAPGLRDAAWRDVQQALDEGKPQSALKALEGLELSAIAARAWDDAARAIATRVHADTGDRPPEDPERLVRLEAAIGRAPDEVKPVLEAILANWTWGFFQNNQGRFAQRTQGAAGGVSEEGKAVDGLTGIASWDLPRVVAEVRRRFTAALDPAERLQRLPVGDWNQILDKGSMPDAWRPTVWDVVAHDALAFAASGLRGLADPEDVFEFDIDAPPLGTRAEFLAWQPEEATTDSDSPLLGEMRLFRRLLEAHAGDADRTALLSADLDRIERASASALSPGGDDERNARTTKALEALLADCGENEVAAMVRHRLAGILRLWEDDDAVVRAREIAAAGAAAHPDSAGGKLCKNLVAEIDGKSLDVFTERTWTAPWPTIRARYKNLTKVHVRIVKADWHARLRAGKPQWQWLDDGDRAKLVAAKPLKAFAVDLPATDNLRDQTHDIKAPEDLPPGAYWVLASAADDFGADDNVVATTLVWVTRLAVVQRTNVFTGAGGPLAGHVVDSATGIPLAGATVQAFVRAQAGNPAPFEPAGKVTTDADGYYELAVAPQRETLLQFSATLDGALHEIASDPLSVWQQEQPQQHASFILMADRGIHRPGQIVRYKGILAHADRTKGDYRALADREVNVTFRDSNGRELSRQMQKSNATGSFHGEFAIPSGALPGQWMIVTEAEGVSGFLGVRVEEYKRPKFKVDLAAPRNPVVLDKAVSLVGTATTYTGLPVAGAKVRYRVERQMRFPPWCRWFFPWLPFEGAPARIARGSTTTDADGKFTVEFPAKPDRSVPVESLPVFTYRVIADITDPAGETRSADRAVRAGFAPLQIDVKADAWQATGPDGAPAEVTLTVTTQSLDDEPRAATGTLTIRRLVQPEQPLRGDLLQPFAVVRPRAAGRVAPGALRGWKPGRIPAAVPTPDPNDPEGWESGEEVFKAEDTTDGVTGKAVAKVTLGPGIYRAEFVVAKADGTPDVKARQTIQVIAPDATAATIKRPLMLTAATMTAQPGRTFEALVATGYDQGRVLVEVLRDGKLFARHWTEPGRTQWPVRVEVGDDHRGGFTLRAWMVRDGRMHLKEQVIDVPWTNKTLEIAWERFTRRVEPGAKEVWRARVKTADDALDGAGKGVPAEIVATLYDQSLDALSPLAWPPGLSGLFRREASTVNTVFSNRPEVLGQIVGSWAVPQAPVEISFRRFRDPFGPQSMQFFGFNRRGMMPMMRGAMPAAPMMADAMMAEGLMGRAAAPARMLAKGAPVALGLEMDFAAVGAGGGLPPAANTAAAPPPPRKNLVETAFFLPHLTSNDDGSVTIEFTLPDTLTTWQFKSLAHDASLRSGTLLDTAVAAKDLMVEPVVPRFLREGDVVEIPVKVGNRSTGLLAGKVRLEFFDARSGDSRQALLETPAEQPFELAAGQSKPVVFRVRVPDGTETLRYLATGSAGRAADGEEAFLPVLSRRVLVDESVPITLRGPGSKTVTIQRLATVKDHPSIASQSLVVQAASNPAWYAVLALPSIAESTDESVESLFTRLYANTWAGHIARSDERIAAAFQQWRSPPPGQKPLESPLEKNSELMQTLLGETPWVREAVDEREARHRIGLLFDANRANDEQASALRRLEGMRSGDGGWPWFPGGRTCTPVTLSIISGFGRLRSAGVGIDIQPALATLPWLDGQFVEWRNEAEKRGKGEPTIDSWLALALYARSFFTADMPAQGEAAAAIDFWRTNARMTWMKVDSRRSQGHLAIALARAGDRETALSIIDSLRQRAVDADVKPGEEQDAWQGMWWRDPHPAWWQWAAAPIETQAIMIEAFDEVAGDRDAVEALKVWLLSQKRTSRWRGNQATADAVGALLGRGEDLLAATELVTIEVGGEKLEPGKDGAPRAEAGTGFVETRFTRREIEPRMGNVTLSRQAKGLAFGGVHWQYLDDIANLPAVGRAELAIDKQLFVKRQTKAGPELVPAEADGTTQVEVGDELVVRLVVTSDRAYEFLELSDHRPSITEPIDVLSGWRWADGAGWYLAVRDASTQFFFERLPRGTHVFEYSLRAAHRGAASSGFAAIRSRYAPEFQAHSGSVKVEVK